jgi:predicted RND superfamily exporter protein
VVVKTGKIDEMPVVKELKDFDQTSGNHLERLVFNNRVPMIIVCLIVTLVLAYQATKLVFNANFEKMIPHNQAYVKNYLQNKSELYGLGNSIRVVVENTRGDIFDAEYIETLKQVNDEVFLTRGVDRAWMKSIWTPAVRWDEITEEGYRGGPVMPDTYDGSQGSIDQLRQNIARAGIVGDLVADNFKSAAIFVPLLDTDPQTGKRLDYKQFSKNLEDIRTKYTKNPKIRIHIIGFAKLAGDLLAGLFQVMTYFAFAALIAGIFIFLYNRCLRSTLMLVGCSLVALVWLLGLIATFGYELDP